MCPELRTLPSGREHLRSEHETLSLNPSHICVPTAPVLREQRQEDLWGSLAAGLARLLLVHPLQASIAALDRVTGTLKLSSKTLDLKGSKSTNRQICSKHCKPRLYPDNRDQVYPGSGIMSTLLQLPGGLALSMQRRASRASNLLSSFLQSGRLREGEPLPTVTQQ